jgi:hypothetical protein
VFLLKPLRLCCDHLSSSTERRTPGIPAWRMELGQLGPGAMSCHRRPPLLPPWRAGDITFSCGEKEKRNVSPVP